MSRTTLAFLFVGLSGLVCALLFSLIGATLHPPLQPPAPDRLRPTMVFVGHALTVIGALGVVISSAWRRRRTDPNGATGATGQLPESDRF